VALVQKPVCAVIGVTLMVLASLVARAIDATWEYAVQVTAAVETSPPKITLVWPQDTQALPKSYTVYRKSQDATSWGNGAELAGSATSYVDTAVEVGTAYEYQVVKFTPGYSGYGYIFTGINVPAIENRGVVILVVANTYAGELMGKLGRLEQDMIGDGWSVIRHDVAQTQTVASVKALIEADYRADPANVKAVFLFGHVPVPYSGDIIPDGHYPDHEGAWPADAYYGDVDGVWTDTTVSSVTASDPRNWNVPGDGKFDQSQLPSAVELEVGRVDLANLPGRTSWNGPATFPGELDLLRQYLNKDHNFRQGTFTGPRRAVLYDDFGLRGGEAFAASGYRSLGTFFGAENILTLTNRGEWLSTLSANSFLWAYGCGAGSYTSLGGLGHTGQYDDATTTELVQADPKAVFTMVFGSWLGDWDSEDNIMRSVLAAPSGGLATMWSGRPHWFLHHMALGENIGYSARLTQNNSAQGLYKNQVNSAAGQIHVALMGDPTLRMYMVSPPSNVVFSGGALTWTASRDHVAGYHVYRAAASGKPFTRLTSSLVGGTTFNDPKPIAGQHIYMVRAVKLEQTRSGSFVNPSQGAFWTNPQASVDPIRIVESAPTRKETALAAPKLLAAQISSGRQAQNTPGAAQPLPSAGGMPQEEPIKAALKLVPPAGAPTVSTNRLPPTGVNIDFPCVDDGPQSLHRGF